jgi:hypothetical protein
MSGAVPPLPNTPPRGAAQLYHRGNSTFTFHSSFIYEEPQRTKAKCMKKKKNQVLFISVSYRVWNQRDGKYDFESFLLSTSAHEFLSSNNTGGGGGGWGGG